jgi:hypothetical protein
VDELEEELLELEVLTALYGSEPQVEELVVAVATAARPETRIAETRILNYWLSLQWTGFGEVVKVGAEELEMAQSVQRMWLSWTRKSGRPKSSVRVPETKLEY